VLFVVTEFIPYVFQVLALMLEMHADGAVSPPYLALFPHLLLPVLWSRDGNIPPLVRLLQAYVSRGIRQIETDKLASIYQPFSIRQFIEFPLVLNKFCVNFLRPWESLKMSHWSLQYLLNFDVFTKRQLG